jgi:hypothetical protein
MFPNVLSLIALIMEAARTSETSVYNYFTRQYIPEDKSELHNRRRENLKPHTYLFFRNVTHMFRIIPDDGDSTHL